MREFFGMILGCALTILVVYLHDSGIGAATTTEPAQATRQIVNWDVAAGEWTRMEHNARVAWDKLTANVEKART
jgi:hypothetical protein